MKYFKTLTAGLLAAHLLLACKKEKEAFPSEFYGETIKLGNGTVKSFYRTSEDGEPMEMGVAISEDAMNSLPHATNQDALDLPIEAIGKTPFQFVLFDYNHIGHEPQIFYGESHFDVHFYLTPDADRLKIHPTTPGSDALPDAAYLPQPGVAGGVVPAMGNHWSDVTSPEFNGGKFTHTFIYGTMAGKVNFLEPMVTDAFVKTATHGHYPIKQPQKYEIPGLYPSEYSIHHNTDAKQYEISIAEFVKR